AGVRTAYRGFYGRSRRARRFLREFRGRDPRFHLALTAANVNYATRYRSPGLSPEPGYVASPEDVAGLLEASQAPAQEALNVAFTNARSGLAPTPS
ncbi:MAG: hypothetical protein ACRDZW_04325, partial [Acidimicrobiales bacterium]